MTTHAQDKILMILTGPVGGGKSSLASATAKLLQARGVGATTIDLDQIYCMARQGPGFDDEAIWSFARRGAAALSDVFFASIARVVIVEGGFHHAKEIAELAGSVTTRVRLEVIALRVSYAHALERVTADTDPGRVLSRNPDVLKKLHALYATALPYLQEVSTVLEADIASIDSLAVQIAALVPH